MDSLNGSSSTPIDVHEIINTQFITQLEAGIIPWRQSWAYGDIPRNLISNRPYGGINLWSLLAVGYERNLFLTWEQIKAIGGSVNKGETGHIVVYWQKRESTPDRKATSKLRYYKVFNVAQCTDIRHDLIPPLTEANPDHSPLVECEAIINRYFGCPKIEYKGKVASYSGKDIITMPPKKNFAEPEQFYRVLFHELIRSTSAPHRLNRRVHNYDPQYSIESVIADMGCSFLCSTAGIMPNTMSDAGAIIQNWLPAFKEHKHLLVNAASQAQRAANYILNVKEAEVTDEAEEEKDESVVQ